MSKNSKKKKHRSSGIKTTLTIELHKKLFLTGTAAVLLLIVVGLLIQTKRQTISNTEIYQEKIELLESSVLAQEAVLPTSPAGGQAGQAVFLSVCNTAERASVFCGTGTTLEAAWKNADKKVLKFLEGSNYVPVWVKADVVCSSDTVDEAEFIHSIKAARHEFYRFGVAFDKNYETALLEAELNGAKIFDYENGGIDLDYLNRYLAKADRGPLEELPAVYTVFQCKGWFCDENNIVYTLSTDALNYGRRQIETIDEAYAKELIMNASSFLLEQIGEDGSFVYGIYPRFDREIENYNIVRHASTLWSLNCRYRLAPDDELAEKIDRAIGYMLAQIVYDRQGRAYLYEEKDDEIKLGGCGIAIVALTEYMDVFQDDKYVDVCKALGEGILSMQDSDSGGYYHVLNGDFTPKERMRTVYYDGEATFALCRLYSLTGNLVWLDAAQNAVEYFIREDYTQYKDHWVAYSMNEITKHITDHKEYYDFALKNAQANLQTIYERDTTYHTYLELLMATFEVYDRMCENGITVEDFDLPLFLDTIYTRADRQLNGYFYPEYAMYMANPQRILDTFMVRHDGYRVRIDDVQHNIGGYYLYYKNYDKLVKYGLLDARNTALQPDKKNEKWQGRI